MADAFEIAISFDTTSSMFRFLEEVRRSLDKIVRKLKEHIPGIRIAIFAHGDYDTHAMYVTKHIDFTDDVARLCNFVQNVEMVHGRDFPECYELVLREVQEKLSWSPGSHKVLVMVGDAPPHERDFIGNRRRLDWREETQRLRDMDVKIYAVDCRGSYQEFYQHMASQTFGYYWPLSNINEVGDLLLKICFREAGLKDDGSFTKVSGSIPASQSSKPSPAQGDTKRASATNVLDRLMEESSSDEDETVGMRCDICSVLKLPNEFPESNVSDQCKHCPGVCLRCVVSYVSNHGLCPAKDCGMKVPGNIKQTELFEATLDSMFTDYAKIYDANRRRAISSTNDVISVSTITGDSAYVPFNPNMTIEELKREVEKQLLLKESSQKLLFKDTGLKNFFLICTTCDSKFIQHLILAGPGKPSRLSDYGIQQNDQLTVIVPLFCIPEDLDHVVFDLFWEFPKDHPDFLDASCLAFKGTQFIQVIDWNHSTNKYYLKDAIQHSAKNEIRGSGRFGHQTIHVYLKRLPFHVSHLYFILSSWKSANLSAFSNPSLQFYDASSPEVNLCSTTFTHALSHQAVVMCSVVRVGSQWQIYECDTEGCVNGNAKRYNPIRERVVNLIENER